MRRVSLFVILLAAMSGQASADKPFAPVKDSVVKDQCGTCHLVYQPQMLPKRSWRALMTTLPKHFGVDATDDDAARDKVLEYYERHAADIVAHKQARKFMRGIRRNQTPLRITDTPRWKRKHLGKRGRGKKKLPATVWQRKSVGSKSNCDACHRQAVRGNYDDDTVRIPK